MLGCFFKKEKALRNLGAYSFNRLVPFFCTKNGEATPKLLGDVYSSHNDQ